ncbi:phage tail tape measure protein [Sphingomonas jatrophae]|uniref:Phage tail tape measure protein, TP901 family, core region n=1 Tax=Sphingomonas jatrophae TaxID=1166337 RepID=A0A1I6JLE2_9SPHN|nr:phage tail tape measure protein [Sphingomonas jatrophae]SFR79737.1 phage tail tape measure protein, TP901 family, core region [Sphingomonas jatrophae]
MADRDLRIRMLLQAADKVTRPLRDIAGGSTKAGQALKVTRDRLKEIERAQADLQGFRQLKTGLRDTERASEAAQTKVGQLARAIAAAEKPNRQMSRDLERARRESQALTRQRDQELSQLQEFRTRLDAAGISTRNLVRHERELRDAAARTSREFEEQSRRLAIADDRARRFAAGRAAFDRTQARAAGLAAGGAAAIGTGFALSRPVTGSVKAAQEYESVMSDIGQKADLLRSKSEQLGRGLLRAARDANQLPAAMQAGVDTLSGLGATVPDAVAMMRPIGRAATAYKAEIADLANASFAAHDNLRVDTQDTGRALDIMATAGKRGAFEVKDMAAHFPELTASMQGLGAKGLPVVADLAAALQITRKGAGDSATAANNLQNLLAKATSGDTIKNFAKFGIDIPKALKRAVAEGRSPIEELVRLTQKATGGDGARLSALFGDMQVQQALRPLMANMALYRQIRADALGATGTVDADFAERMRDSAEQSRQLAVNAEVLKVTLGAALLPTVNALVQRLSAGASWLAAFSAQHPRLTKAAMILAGGLAVLFGLLGLGAIVAAGIMAPLAIVNAGMVALGVAGGVASIGLLPIIGTVALIAAGIAALGTAIYIVATQGFGALAAVLVNWSPLGLMWRGIAALLAMFGIQVPAKLTEAGGNMIRGLIRGITGMLGALKSTIVNAASAAAGWFKAKLGIHSPSRVFASFGGFMMQGLSQGIDGGASVPVRRIQRLSREVTAAMAIGAAVPAIAAGNASAGPTGMRGAASRAAAPPPAASGTIVFNYHAAPGVKDARAEARAMFEELKKLEAADRRASYADQPDWSDRG